MNLLNIYVFHIDLLYKIKQFSFYFGKMTYF